MNVSKHVICRIETPAATRTIDETGEMSSHHTRFHVSDKNSNRRYQKMEHLGKGTYGEVSKAVDMDVGDLLVVKIIKIPRNERQQEVIRREICALSSLGHVSQIDLGSYVVRS